MISFLCLLCKRMMDWIEDETNCLPYNVIILVSNVLLEEKVFVDVFPLYWLSVICCTSFESVAEEGDTYHTYTKPYPTWPPPTYLLTDQNISGWNFIYLGLVRTPLLENARILKVLNTDALSIVKFSTSAYPEIHLWRRSFFNSHRHTVKSIVSMSKMSYNTRENI